MKNFRGIYTAPVPSWAIQLPVGAQAAVDGGDIPVWGEVVGYAHEMERLYDGHIRSSDDFWSKVSGRFILIKHWDGSQKAYAHDEVFAWSEEKVRATPFSRILCACGFHIWDGVRRRGLLRATIDFAVFTAAAQIGEERCTREGCATSRVRLRQGVMGHGSKPKWKKAPMQFVEEFHRLTIC